MKITWGFIAIIFVAGLTVAVAKSPIFFDKAEDAGVLRVAFPYAQPAKAYEPTKIYLGPQYIFLQNIFSPLVEMSPKDAKIIGGVAEDFKWIGNDLHLTIRHDLKTASGIQITAEDVVLSLKRLIILSGNTHGNFKDLVCPGAELKKFTENCSGISSKGNVVILKAGTKKSFLLPMLTAIDFAIIPKSSIDPKTLIIINYKETSGPYFVEQDSEKGHLVLKANPFHYKYSKNIPQSIQLVPTTEQPEGSSLKDFADNKVDMITTIDSSKPEDVMRYAREQNDSNLHITMNIRSYILIFTERGLKELTQQQRHSIGKKVQTAFRSVNENRAGYEKSEQFFPSFGDGALKETDLQDLRKQSEISSETRIPNLKMTLIRLGELKTLEEAFKKQIPNLDVSEGKNAPAFSVYKNKNEMPHMFIGGPDTSFTEDISLISYTVGAGFFGMSKLEQTRWLTKYSSINDKDERMALLRKKHKEAILTGTLVPLMVSPYVALVRKPWTLELSQFFADNPLWLVKHL